MRWRVDFDLPIRSFAAAAEPRAQPRDFPLRQCEVHAQAGCRAAGVKYREQLGGAFSTTLIFTMAESADHRQLDERQAAIWRRCSTPHT